MAMTVGQKIAEQAQRQPQALFLAYPEKELSLTYGDLEHWVDKTARLLKKLGIQHNDKVAILLPNIPEFIYFYWGCMRLGAVACPINTLLKGPEIAYVSNHSESKVFVTTPEFFAEISRILPELKAIQSFIIIPDTPEASGSLEILHKIDFYAAIEDDSTLPSCPSQDTVSPDNEAMIIYTSGTTGKPKGVILTHRNLLADAKAIAQWFNIKPKTRMMCILPLFHVNGEVVTLMTPLYAGASVVLNRKFSASRFWPMIQDYQVNMFSTVPTILSMLLANPTPQEDISSLQYGICGAAPLPVEVHKQFEKTFAIPIYEGYGLSETTCYSTFNPPHTHERIIGSIGVAVGNEVAIWDDKNQALPIGEEGEIVIRGENVMKGYFKNPEANEKAFAGGWFHTGDWGKVDEEGFFYILDRVKDMIIRGGENIYPREVDEVLYAHPAIEAAATIGIPDVKYGETVKSFVVLKHGQAASEIELIAYCKENLANYKCPEAIAFILEIPKGPTGKLLRRELRALEISSSAN